MTPGARWLSVRPSPAPLVIAARANLGNVYERGTLPGILPGGVALYEIPRDTDILPFMLAEVHSFAVQGEPGACLLDEDVGSVRHVFRLFQPPVEFRHRVTPFPGSVNLRQLYLRTLRLRNIVSRSDDLQGERAGAPLKDAPALIGSCASPVQLATVLEHEGDRQVYLVADDIAVLD